MLLSGDILQGVSLGGAPFHIGGQHGAAGVDAVGYAQAETRAEAVGLGQGGREALLLHAYGARRALDA